MLFNVNEIASVYSGKDGKCCCGCSGKHYYASAHRAEASKHRGYEVSDEEVSNRMVTRVANILSGAAADEIKRNSECCYSTVVGKRVYIVYLVSSATAAVTARWNAAVALKEQLDREQLAAEINAGTR
jgi:hypothetical protein